MSTQIVIQESDLELVVKERTLGSLTTNAIQIRDMVRASLHKYDISNYDDDNIDQAKRDKAILNKAAKALNDRRIEIEREFMKPFGELKEVVSETVKLIGECSSRIDTVIKQNEQIYKDNKKKAIRDYFDENNVNLVDFNKIYKDVWLNKTVKEKTVFSEIDQIFAGIERDIQTIESMPEDADVLRTYYLDTLNINSTIQYGNRLKEQRERAKAAEEARKKIEEERSAVPNPFAGHSQSNQIPFMKQPEKQPAAPFHEEHPVAQNEEILTRAFKVTTTRKNITALGDFMNEKGIDFEKIELNDFQPQ
jgi:hypothetical protein